MTDGDGGTTSRCLLSVSFIFSLDTCSVQEALYVTRLYLVIAYGVHPRRPISSLGLLCLSQVLTMTTRSLSPPPPPPSPRAPFLGTVDGSRSCPNIVPRTYLFLSFVGLTKPKQAQARTLLSDEHTPTSQFFSSSFFRHSVRQDMATSIFASSDLFPLSSLHFLLLFRFLASPCFPFPFPFPSKQKGVAALPGDCYKEKDLFALFTQLSG